MYSCKKNEPNKVQNDSDNEADEKSLHIIFVEVIEEKGCKHKEC